MSLDTADGEGAVALPDPVVEDLLETARRRHLLRALAEADEPVPLDDLAGAVRARERGTAPESIPAGERRDLRREFLATDVPKLTATGVATYDSMLATLELEVPALATAAAAVDDEVHESDGAREVDESDEAGQVDESDEAGEVDESDEAGEVDETDDAGESGGAGGPGDGS